ncbi:hypothetical protein CUJ84_Chr002493 [Rhizobium leguminosarum]|uniref:Uncharacterized protein n=1 Tax=Rhizobium leguminosarum TaxID=384 RepID=A0A2K9Z3P7_RHILE|nr:hypothetical protein CUJ84_Chr002493 [Rhizobium leguminosarum]
MMALVDPAIVGGAAILRLCPKSRNPVASKSLPVSIATRHCVNKSRQTPEMFSPALAEAIRAKFRSTDKVIWRKQSFLYHWHRRGTRDDNGLGGCTKHVALNLTHATCAPSRSPCISPGLATGQYAFALF